MSEHVAKFVGTSFRAISHHESCREFFVRYMGCREVVLEACAAVESHNTLACVRSAVGLHQAMSLLLLLTPVPDSSVVEDFPGAPSWNAHCERALYFRRLRLVLGSLVPAVQHSRQARCHP